MQVRFASAVALILAALHARLLRADPIAPASSAATPLIETPHAATAPPPPVLAPNPPPPVTGTAPLDPHRLEFGGFPIVAGNTDIGTQFGVAGTLTRFSDPLAPYLWNLDVFLSMSLKNNDGSVKAVQQKHLLRLDAPGLLGGILRMDTRGSFERTINAGYYGLGNASSAAVPPGTISVGRHYQFLFEEMRVRTIARVKTGTPIDIALGGNFRYVIPTAYPTTQLAQDEAIQTAPGTQYLYGVRETGIGTLAGGIIYDTRDTEFITGRGIYYQVGVGASFGTSSERIANGNASAVLAHYLPIYNFRRVGPLVFASRVVTSFEFGRVPFYDLAQGGTFEPQGLLGGDSGVRGVPEGRYAGLIKAITNLELRQSYPRFHFLGQRLLIGSTLFVDLGRAWNDYKYDPARDGTGLGLKYGIGSGVFLQWGEAAIFRVDVAYSPDQVAENPGFPVGIYAADGVQF